MKEIAVNPNTIKKPMNQMFKKSRTSLLIMSALCTAYSGLTFAQQADEQEAQNTDETEVIEVKGMRSNITAAQHIKRFSSTIVDSISAEDIGDFPDKSVAEALQRVPGITVERFGSRTDTKAFSVEPSGVLVRGLSHVRSEFNGRDTFSANSSRGLSWGDISPELMGGIDVYKNQTAELIEGGIAGLINLRTRLPFDSENDFKSVTVKGNYSDLAQSTTPELSGIYTTRFNTDIGEFGLMANLAYSDVDAQAQTSRIGRMIKFRGVYGDPDELHYMPDKFIATDDQYQRQRFGTSLALQWQDNDGDFLATFQYNRSQKEQTRLQKGIQSAGKNPFFKKSLLLEATPGGDGANAILAPAPGSDPFTFDENGVFQTGTLLQQQGWWGKDNADSALRAMNSNGEALVEACAGAWANCGDKLTHRAHVLETNGGIAENKSVTEDFGLNLKWHISDTVHANFDVQYVDATNDDYSITAAFHSWADPIVDLSGEQISVVFSDPTGVNALDAGQGIFANPNNYWLDNIMDMYEDSEGDEFAARADLVFDVQNEFVSSVKVGVRYADREQNVNRAGNWQNVMNTWTGPSANNSTAPFFNIDSGPASGTFNGKEYNFTGYPDAYELAEWTANYGDFSSADGTNLFVTPNRNAMLNWKNTMGANTIGSPVSQWDPVCSGVGVRSGEVDGGCFLPIEMINVSEQTNAAYVQVNFDGDDFTLFGKQLSGNIGVRYVETEIFSSGGEKYPNFDENLLICEDKEFEDPTDIPDITKTIGCFISNDDAAFSNNGNIEGSSNASHSHLLPSFNLKMDVTDKFVTRLALSKALTRPDIGNLRHFIEVQTGLPSTDNINDAGWIKDANGDIVEANIIYSSKASNPHLKPVTAKQVDLSFEYYADGGSASLALFHKSFDDYIQSGASTRELTNNGVTNTVTVIGPINGDGAKLHGLELQGTKWFDFLPAPFNGLGIQANYTYVENEGIENSGVSSSNASGSLVTNQAPDLIEVDTLEGLSKEAYNLTLMYQLKGFQAKLAYNWRDEFLVTNSDCCIAYPIWQDEFGQLDASVRYKINKTFELSLSAQNLTGEEAILTQQVDNSSDGGKRLPYSTNQSDTRYTMTLRMKF
jgi:TonB-dependent receptor